MAYEPQAEGWGDPLSGVDPAVDPHGLLVQPVVQRQLRRETNQNVHKLSGKQGVLTKDFNLSLRI